MNEAADVIARETQGLRLESAPGCQWCCHQLAEMSERATRIQLTVNFRRPMDGVFELREVLVALLDRDTAPPVPGA